MKARDLVDRIVMARARWRDRSLERSPEVRILAQLGGVGPHELTQAEYEWLLADAGACRRIRRHRELTWFIVVAAATLVSWGLAFQAGFERGAAAVGTCYIVERTDGTAGVECSPTTN